MPRDRQIFCAAMLTPSVKAGNASWSFGDLLDGHPGGHAGRDRLHGLGWVFAEHVRAEDGVGPAVRDQLAEALWPATPGLSPARI